MSDALLLEMGRRMLPIPRLIWDQVFRRSARADLSFMSVEHHSVRNFVVGELLNTGRPLSPEDISKGLRSREDLHDRPGPHIPEPQVVLILEELERHMTFLFRNAQGEVTWAYPVTVEPTPHRVPLCTPSGVQRGQAYAA
jgi:hypothetical protein